MVYGTGNGGYSMNTLLILAGVATLAAFDVRNTPSVGTTVAFWVVVGLIIYLTFEVLQ